MREPDYKRESPPRFSARARIRSKAQLTLPEEIRRANRNVLTRLNRAHHGICSMGCARMSDWMWWRHGCDHPRLSTRTLLNH